MELVADLNVVKSLDWDGGEDGGKGKPWQGNSYNDGMERPTLDSLQLGSAKSHGKVKRNVVLVVAHRHEKLELHLCKHLQILDIKLMGEMLEKFVWRSMSHSNRQIRDLIAKAYLLKF